MAKKKRKSISNFVRAFPPSTPTLAPICCWFSASHHCFMFCVFSLIFFSAEPFLKLSFASPRFGLFVFCLSENISPLCVGKGLEIEFEFELFCWFQYGSLSRVFVCWLLLKPFFLSAILFHSTNWKYFYLFKRREICHLKLFFSVEFFGEILLSPPPSAVSAVKRFLKVVKLKTEEERNFTRICCFIFFII